MNQDDEEKKHNQCYPNYGFLGFVYFRDSEFEFLFLKNEVKIETVVYY